MISNNTKKEEISRKKVYFIRVNEPEYKKITELAESEDRSINNMANLLIKSALSSTEHADRVAS